MVRAAAASVAALLAGCAPQAGDGTAPGSPGPGASEGSITVVSYGGSYARACVLGYHESFTEETGIQVNLEDFNGGLAQIRAQVEAGAVHWDVVDLGVADTITGCDEGVLELIEPELLPPGPNGEPPADDFLPETNTECGVGTLLYLHDLRLQPGDPAGSRAGDDRRLLRSGALPRAPGHAAEAGGEPGVRADGRRRAEGTDLRVARDGGGS